MEGATGETQIRQGGVRERHLLYRWPASSKGGERKAPGLSEREGAKEDEGGKPTRGTTPRYRLGPDWPACQHKRRGQKRWRRPEERAALIVLGGDWTAGRKCGEEAAEQRRGRGRDALGGRRIRLRPPKGELRVCSPPSPTVCRSKVKEVACWRLSLSLRLMWKSISKALETEWVPCLA